MSTLSILRRLLIPSSGCGFGISVVHAKKKQEEPKCDESRHLVRACELPLYTEEKPCPQCTSKEENPSLLIETIRCARQELWVLMEQAKIASENVTRCFEEIKEDAQCAVDFLREESNTVPRFGAIAIGGLTGFILGIRKGPVTRFLYTATGAAAMTALCYPKETQEYTQEGLKHAKKYILISYHFLNGVSRDLTGYQLPALPLPLGHLVNDPADVVPSSAQLLPPTANATHIPMPHEERSDEVKKILRDQSNPEDKDLYTRRA